MRQGYVYWETFWKWLQKQARSFDKSEIEVESIGDWLVFRSAEFAIKWRNGEFQTSP